MQPTKPLDAPNAARNRLTQAVIGCAIQVHRTLGPGLLEPAYEACLAFELDHDGIAHVRQQKLPPSCKGNALNCDLRADMVVADKLIVEVKSVQQLLPVHEAQLLTYLKASGLHLRLLLNFNETVLRNGIRRRVLDLPPD
ncbi:MAG TPA: GxxExxY protein [Rhodopila sp.]|nr:GxxExxY protein [Rhodopila sp.]